MQSMNGIPGGAAALLGGVQQQVQLAVDPGVLANVISDRAIYLCASQIYCQMKGDEMVEDWDDTEVQAMAARDALDLFDATTEAIQAWAKRKKEAAQV